MLTLQNILDSDSIATLVAKLNANFQTISLSNGGPQGVRGEQGIPGLPGKQGATGPIGPAGATGPGFGVIPFSLLTQTSVGPAPGNTSSIIPQPDASYNFLTTTNAWGPTGPSPGQVWFDNNQLGWWKYLTIPDPDPTDPNIGADIEPTQGGPYSIASGGWNGPGWYFYPIDLSGIISITQGVWSADKTNYLGRLGTPSGYSSASTGPTSLTSQDPYGIVNARMNSKFGTVWISSLDAENSMPTGPGSPFPGGDDTYPDTSMIYFWDYNSNNRLNAGVDRSLFKMSIDGPRYFDNMKARGFRNTDLNPSTTSIIGVPYQVNGGGTGVPFDSGAIVAASPGSYPAYFVQPLYDVSIDAYSPIIYFSNRPGAGEGAPENTSLGYYQFAPPAQNDISNTSTFIHLFSTRQADEFFDPATGNAQQIGPSSNTGEMLFDVRRVVTTNQFLNMLPQDTEDYTSQEVGFSGTYTAGFDPRNGNTYRDWSSGFAWKSYQGYHSVFTGQIVTDQGEGARYPSLFEWFYDNRQSWYGTSLYAAQPTPLTGGSPQELIRSAGMIVRGESGPAEAITGWVIPGTPTITTYNNNFVDKLMFYTANMSANVDPDQNNYDSSFVSYSTNKLLSLPMVLFSHTKNVGIGTVTNFKDGMWEPTARLHVHSDWRPLIESYGRNTDYSTAFTTGSFSTGIDKSWLTYTNYAPQRRMKSAAFTIERNSPATIYGNDVEGSPFLETRYETGPSYFDDWYGRGVFNDILIGAVAAPDYEPTNLGQTTFIKPSSAIRYESFNWDGTPGDIWPTGPAVPVDPNSITGWEWKGALRFGSTPYMPLLFGPTNPYPQNEIGSSASLQNLEFQLSLTPLSYNSQTSSTNDDIKGRALTGIGMHNLYPRARVHMFGKNAYQEFRFDEPASPGFVEPTIAAGTAVTVPSWTALQSDNQIVIDYILSKFVYNAALYDYSYDYLLDFTSTTVPNQWSQNARNYPLREIAGSSSNTRSTFNPIYNRSFISAEAVTVNGYNSLHGGVNNAEWDVNKYIGFNLYRDLLNRGDYRGATVLPANYINVGASFGPSDLYASTWRTGSEGNNVAEETSNNGGSAIFSDTSGKMGFAFLPNWRDGGRTYGQWEQQHIGTREIVNNIKIVFDERGNIGVGNSPGLDQNAYPSARWEPQTGKINYLPNANGAVADPTVNSPLPYSALKVAGAPWTPSTYYDTYGYSFSGAGSAYAGYSPSAINAKATYSDIIRFEVAAEKAQGLPGEHIDRRGYGYPGWKVDTAGLPTGSGGQITITDNATNTFANRYLGVPISSLGWAGGIYEFTTDNLGRIMYLVVTLPNKPNFDPGENILLTYPNSRLPHPTEFGPGGPFDTGNFAASTFLWTTGMSLTVIVGSVTVTPSQNLWIPTSAVAAELEELIYQGDDDGFAEATFLQEDLQPANMRLNNFTFGDGYQLMRTGGDVTALAGITGDVNSAATQAIQAGRTASPKIMLTFGAVDYSTMNATGISQGDQDDLISAGVAPLMKVTTVIESGQTDTSLRTYTIPKADNTGGSFMVITDHMGDTEKADPGLAELPANNADTIVLDKVVAHEVVRTGLLQPDQTDTPGLQNGYWEDGSFIIWPRSYEMLPIHYTRTYASKSLVCEQVFSDPRRITPDTNRIYGAQLRRNVDDYWDVDPYPVSSPYKVDGVTPLEQKTEIRYRRLNSNYVMLDFNIDLRALAFNDGFSGITPNQNKGPLNGLVEEPVLAGNLNAYVHSPYAPGHMLDHILCYDGEGAYSYLNGNVWVGVDARWVQYVRFTYTTKDPAVGSPDDPHFYEREYGGGPSFANWNEYRSWYPGTATVGPFLYTDVSAITSRTQYLDNWGSSGFNASDGTSTVNPQWNTAGTGAGYNPPIDGSPYSAWNSADTPPDTSPNTWVRYVKYWNGRLNDWYQSRWQQAHPAPNEPGVGVGNYQAAYGWANPSVYGLPTTTNNDSYFDTGANDNVPNNFTLNPYSDTYPQNFNHPGYDGANWRSWQNDEITFKGYIVQPTFGGNTLDYNQNFINRYAYKTLWKFYQGYRFANFPANEPYSILYTEHPKIFDSIVNRTFGDDAWTRSGNMQWRITPVGKGDGQYTVVAGTPPFGLTTNYTKEADNITFAIEIMFDKPIFVSGRSTPYLMNPDNTESEYADWHSGDATLSNAQRRREAWEHMRSQEDFWGLGAIRKSQVTDGELFGSDGDIFQKAPYSNITLRGQAVVKYQKSTYNETTTLNNVQYNR